MSVIQHNPETLFPPYRNYSHAVEVRGNSTLLFISGLNGYLPDGQHMPDTFEEQGELIWKYIGEILKSANMNYDNVVSIRTYLADAAFDEANVLLRMKYMGNNRPPSTVVVSQLLDKKWKLEVEVVAAQ